MTQPQISFRDVSFAYTDRWLVQHVRFDVEPNTFISIIGPSGCGKSTLFRLLNGLERIQTGEIYYRDRHMQYGDPSSCAFMPQKDILLPWRNIWQNVALPLELAGVSQKERQARAMALLEHVGLAKWSDHRPSELSGGMRQRVSFCRTLITGHETLLLDEPFSALDALTKRQLENWLMLQWYEEPKTILLVTHDVDEAIYLSQRILVMVPDEQTGCITSLMTVDVPFDFPRQANILGLPQAQAIKHQILTALKLDRFKDGFLQEQSLGGVQ